MRENVLSFTAMQRFEQHKNGIQHDWEPALSAPLPPRPKGNNPDRLWVCVLLIEEARDEVLAYLKCAATSLPKWHPERVESEIRRASDRLLTLTEEFQIAHASWHEVVKDLDDYVALPAPGSREEAIQHKQIFKREECQKLRAHAWPM
jgi:hypothetical protein